MTDLRELVARAVSGTDYPSERSYEKADRVLAALSTAGRLPGEVTGEVVDDVENAANKAAWTAAEKHKGDKIPLRDAAILFVAVNAAAPIIAADAERRVRAAVLEEAAALIEATQETFSNQDDGPERFLTPRKHGNIAGLAYVEAIRALKESPHVG